MREIRFRAWDGKKILGPHEPYEESGDEMGAALGGYYVYSNDYPDGKLKIMQYTGLKDKNGVEIYEGDWVRANNGIGKIVFARGMFAMDCGEDHFYALNKVGEVAFEVIGNIYEDTEMVE